MNRGEVLASPTLIGGAAPGGLGPVPALAQAAPGTGGTLI